MHEVSEFGYSFFQHKYFNWEYKKTHKINAQIDHSENIKLTFYE
jgi:hypothetical protein